MDERTERACQIAAGEPGSEEPVKKITGAKRDLNAKGNGSEWYRMVWRSGQWRYVSDERLPPGRFLARERRCSVQGEVYEGEIVVQHDRGKPVDRAYLVCQPNEAGSVLEELPFKKLRSGELRIALPNGTQVDRPDPRSK